MSFIKKLLTDQRRETVVLQSEVPASTTSWKEIASWTVPADATIESLRVWHVPNSEDALKTQPKVSREGSETHIPEYADEGGEFFLTGEPDGSPVSTGEPVSQGDNIMVRAKNENTNYAYRFRIEVTVDYAGGLSRVLGGGRGA